jgi:hypothetical protein
VAETGARMPKMAMRRFPLAIALRLYNERQYGNPEDRCEDVIAALEHRDRVRGIHIYGPTSDQFERIITVMQEPLPALTDISLESSNDEALRVPDTFLNGSAPSLQHLHLWGMSFPSLPRLLLSASHLTTLHFWEIPNTGYISPESMALCLSALTNLETLVIEFQSPIPHPKRRSRPPPPLMRTRLSFRGVIEYMEILATRIDAPLLDYIWIVSFNQLVFDISQIVRFIIHQKLFRPSEIVLFFHDTMDHNLDKLGITFVWPQENSHDKGSFHWEIICTWIRLAGFFPSPDLHTHAAFLLQRGPAKHRV